MIAKVLAIVAGTAAAVNGYTLVSSVPSARCETLTIFQTTQLTGNPVLTPNNNGGAEPVLGQTYTITWDGTGLSNTVDLALCQGPGTACNVIANIAQTSNTNSYSWSVPCSLTATTSNAGYGILLIDDATGMYQYSTQFGFLADTTGACSGSSSSAPASSSSTGASASSSKTGYGGSSMTTSTTSSGSAPTQSGSAPTGGAGGYNTTSTTYVIPTGKPGSSNPAPTYTPSPGAAAAVARNIGLAAAALAAAVFLV